MVWCTNSLFCFAAGVPAPDVTWWRDGHLVDSSFEETYKRTVQNTLSIPNLSRDELSTTLTCMASNNNISVPASNKVIIDMKCKRGRLEITFSRDETGRDETNDYRDGETKNSVFLALFGRKRTFFVTLSIV